VGPEVALAGALAVPGPTKVLLGDEGTLRAAAELLGIAQSKLVRWDGRARDAKRLFFAQVGEPLDPRDRRPGKPTPRAGRAQLEYVEAGYSLVRSTPGAALVTAPVSKSVIAGSGLARARKFRGHTEWLQELDGAKTSVMCFVSDRLATSLVTTHLPLAKVPAALSARGVASATSELALLLRALGKQQPKVAVASLNPHAGEGELLGREEARAIIPGIIRVREQLGRRVSITGPIGAETAYRKASNGQYDGVVAMYHDQATIPMKLLSFGDAVNVTLGLSIVRTSVDHGTAYDIAWRGEADAGGMVAALQLAVRVLR
jgi:4-hydroxythreonine-4-phosphate dehydrogenase